VSLDLVRSVYPPAKGIRLLGVTMSGFGVDEAAPPEQSASISRLKHEPIVLAVSNTDE
jgi:hypothetical protein